MWLNGRCGPAGPQLWQSQLWEAGGMPRDTSLSAHVHGNSTTCQAPRQLLAPVGGLSLHAPRSQDPPP